MKRIGFIIAFASVWYSLVLSQRDTLRFAEIQQYAYQFELMDGIFSGQGADTLLHALRNAQYVMLGNHHRSYQEEVLADAVARYLHDQGCRRVLLEVGPASAQVLNQKLRHGQETRSILKDLNHRFGLKRGEDLYAPIPDLKSIAAADALDFMQKHGWTIHGIGYDSWTSYKMIINHLFENLPGETQTDHHSEYVAAMDLLDSLYANVGVQSNNELLKFSLGLIESQTFKNFYKILEAHSGDVGAMQSLKFSIDYWQMYGERNFYKKNRLNAKRNKVLLQEIFNKTDFDLRKEKLLVRMWRQHLTKGLTANGFFGLGNTLNELAEMQGNNAVNICVIQRNYMEKGVVQDGPDPTDFHAQLFKDFTPLGRQDKYVLVDLSKFNRAFYWNGYHIPKAIEDIYKRYDYLIISKTDWSPKNNY